MKVLHIHRFGLNGGAGGAISMRRLHLGLRRAGIDSKILCVRETAELSHIIVTKPSRLEQKWNSRTAKITAKLGLEDVLNINSRRIRRNRAYKDADIINFHRVPQVFSYLAFPSLTADKPAVFTLHEMWALTGHCRQSLDCERWKIGCGKCPYTHLPPAIQSDGTHFQWKLKKWAYGRSNLTCVAPSTWLSELAGQSILQRFKIYHIPHGIDTEVYKPLSQEMCRSSLGIPQGKKVLMFVAQRLDTFLKGGDLLLTALKGLPQSLKAKIVQLVMGNQGQEIADAVDIQTINLGYVADDGKKAAAYSAADLFVSPTRADNLPLVLQESMACGTPVVSFRVGGVPDLVRNGTTGYLAEPGSSDDLRKGVIQLLENDSMRHEMKRQCRKIALKEYNIDLMVHRYIDLYRQVIGN